MIVAGRGPNALSPPYFDPGDTLVLPAECEKQNPDELEPTGLRAIGSGAEDLQGAPSLFSGDHRRPQ